MRRVTFSLFKRRGATAFIPLAVALSLVVAGPAAAAAPKNDLRTNPTVISPTTIGGASNGTNVEATFGNEPTPSCQSNVGASVWWRYRSPTSMRISMSTSQNGVAIDTILAVYKSTENGLQQVACDDDSGAALYSSLQFVGAGDTNYYIQVSGYLGQSGPFYLDYSFRLANDDFANAQAIKPGFTDAYDTVMSSTQGNEPQSNNCVSMGLTHWYKFKSSTTKSVTFDTLGSSFDTVVAVYRGTSISNLAFVACGDDQDEANGDAVVTWTAEKNKTYYIQVGGYQSKFGNVVASFTRN